MPNPKPVHKKVACEVCLQEYSELYLPVHQRNKHPREYPRKRVRRAAQEIVAAKVETPQFTSSKRRFRHEENFIVLTADDGSIWLAERVR